MSFSVWHSKCKTLRRQSVTVFNGQERIHQDNQIHRYGCSAFETGIIRIGLSISPLSKMLTVKTTLVVGHLYCNVYCFEFWGLFVHVMSYQYFDVLLLKKQKISQPFQMVSSKKEILKALLNKDFILTYSQARGSCCGQCVNVPIWCQKNKIIFFLWSIV